MKKIILSTILLVYTQTTTSSGAFVCALWMESTRKNEAINSLLKKEIQQLKKEVITSESSSTKEQSDEYDAHPDTETRLLECPELCKNN
jgi:hypothetical protein